MSQLISLNSAPQDIQNGLTAQVLQCCHLTE